ncbi:MAG: heavy metal translocating P-type ATPase [Polyangiaceae bacterium]|jgi:Cu+-exporting ATPase|nr:heavy metal translocating P-type ATPase [Polyangiaceae bacterium]
MSCAACVRHVERSLSELDGVLQAEVNLVTARARVTFDPDRIQRAALVEAVVEAGYEVPEKAPTLRPEAAEEDEEERRLRRDLKLTAALGVPLLVLAMSHGAIPWAESDAGRWAQALLATPVLAGPGRAFFVRAWKGLRRRTADMNTLVALGTGAAWAASTAALVAPGLFPHGEHGHRPHLYYEAAAAIVGFVLLGKSLEARARKRLSDAVRGLIALQPATAHRRQGEGEQDIPVEALQVGDTFLVRPGERVPADGMVLEGTSSLDESLLTGESMPVDRGPGDPVTGGTLNQSGALLVRAARTGQDTALARIVTAVEQAQGNKAPVARLADVLSAVFAPVVLALALLAGLSWALLDPSPQGLSVALERFVSVLVIACPCALGLATPAAVAVGTGRGAELGILVRGGAALEAASRVSSVLLDKTGTLTSGKPTLALILPAPGVSEDQLLAWVASVEAPSEHPVARAIVEGASIRNIRLQKIHSFEATAGSGVAATVEGEQVLAGTARWLQERGVEVGEQEDEAARLAAQGHTPVLVARGGRAVGVVAVADGEAPGAAGAIEALRALGVEVAMVTGDREGTARAVAARLRIDRVFAEVRPEQKAALVRQEQQRGHAVAMVGDGVNDAPALAAADVGVAMGTGSDIAAASADLTLLHGGITRLPAALALARATLRTIRQNLFWAFLYNLLGIPIAAGLLAPWTGLQLSPVLASAAMSLSSVSVLANSLRLRRFRAP